MTEKELKNANEIFKKLELKKDELRLFESGKILSLKVRCFNEEKTEYEDIEYFTNLPRTKLKGVMLELLKSERDSLQYQFDNLLNIFAL